MTDLGWAILTGACLIWGCREACTVAALNDELNRRFGRDLPELEPAKDETPAQAHAFEYGLLRSIAKADGLIEDELSRIRDARLTGDEAAMGEYLCLEHERRTMLNTWRRRFGQRGTLERVT